MLRAKYGVEGTSTYLQVVRAIAREAFEEAADILETNAHNIGRMPKANPPDNLDKHRRYGEMIGEQWAYLIRARAKEVCGE